MMGYGMGMGVGGMIAMVVFWVALVALIVWLVTRAFRPGGHDRRGGAGGDRSWQETSDEVLDRRFAAGEIDEATYHRMRETLRSARSPRATER